MLRRDLYRQRSTPWTIDSGPRAPILAWMQICPEQMDVTSNTHFNGIHSWLDFQSRRKDLFIGHFETQVSKCGHQQLVCLLHDLTTSLLKSSHRRAHTERLQVTSCRRKAYTKQLTGERKEGSWQPAAVGVFLLSLCLTLRPANRGDQIMSCCRLDTICKRK